MHWQKEILKIPEPGLIYAATIDSHPFLGPQEWVLNSLEKTYKNL